MTTRRVGKPSTRTPIEDRWGGWYVTGEQVPAKHLGNVPVLHVPKSYVRAEAAPKLATGSDAFDTAAYLTPHSDVVALMVLNHQTRMTNLLTRLGWQSRIAAHGGTNAGGPAQQARETAHELVDYMLFVEEAPLPSPVRGAPAFAREFPAKGPRDSKGRSLRDLDLTRRLLPLPVQLHDLYGGVRCASGCDKGDCLRTDVGDPVGRGKGTGIFQALGCGSAGDYRDPARDEEGSSAVPSSPAKAGHYVL